MSILFGIIVGVIVLTLLVAAHEFGHALVARQYGTVVEEFGIGFPPKAWSKKVPNSILGKDVEYSVNWLPLGGFVRMKGEHDSDTGKGEYGAMTFWQKTQVLLAGVAVNWVLAALLLTVLATIGMPKILPNQFYVAGDVQLISQPVELVSVTPGMPAAQAGLQQGDKILRFAGQPLANAKGLSELAAENRGKTVNVIYSRQSVEHEVKVTLRSNNDDKKGYLGAGPTQRELIKSSWSAPIVGVCTTAQMTWVTLEGLGQVIGNGVSGLFMKLSPDKSTQDQANKNLSAVGDSVAGPLAIFGIIFPAAEKAGATYVLMIAAIISLTLAVMNVLPIPALDGGRWFVTALYRVMRRPLTKEAEERIHGTGFMVLMFLVVLVTIADIGKLR
jgi:regulator of sigma E protease